MGIILNRELWIDADLDFHIAILAASGNAFLMRIGAVLSLALEEIFARSSRNRDDYRYVLAEHKAVLDAIRTRKPEAARDLMETLIRRSLADLELDQNKSG